MILKKIKIGKINLPKFVISTVICLLALTFIIFVCVKFVKAVTFTKKDQLTIYLEDMGKDFYENFYYEQLGTSAKEREDFLKEYKDIGIKVNLETLSRFKGSKNMATADKFVNEKTKKACDRSSTKVIIYPKSPYKRESYKISTELDCN